MTQQEFNEQITKLLGELTAKVKALQEQVNNLEKKQLTPLNKN